MRSVSDVIQEFYVPPLAGDEEVDLKGLQEALKNAKKQNMRHYWISVSAVAILYVTGLIVLILHFNNPTIAAGIFSAIGLSFPFLLKHLRNIGKDMGDADLLLFLVSGLDEEGVKTMLSILLSRETLGKT